MRNLPVNSLQFDSIKANFKDFLKGNPKYADFNFEASGIGTILNIAAYQTHYIGFFVKMLLDESFIDSAHTRSALLSHAKRDSYIPKGKQSAQAEIVLTATTSTTAEPPSLNIAIDRGATFRATNDAQDQRIFSVLDGTTIYDREVDGSTVRYTSQPFKIYEGQFRSFNFVADDSILNQRFILKDLNADVDTFRVRVKENATSTSFIEYKIASDVLDLDAGSNVFFVSTDENGYYQIFFGNNVFGTQPSNGNAIELSYISSNGETGNGARNFVYQGSLPGTVFTTSPTSVSSGGLEPQTIEELRFAIPNAKKRQNRIVTESDFRSIILDKFRNVESLNVWGGETHHTRDYGKVYVSIKPKNSDKLTALSRSQIKDSIVKKYGVVGIEVVFVDPDFINIDMEITARLDLRKTIRSAPEINNLILARVSEYSREKLARFDTSLSDVDLMSYIKADEPAIVSLYSTKTLRKNHLHLHNSSASNTVFFGNKLVPGTLTSSMFSYGNLSVYLTDSSGALDLVDATGKLIVASTGSVDYTTGTVTYTLPRAVRMTGSEDSNSGTLVIKAKAAVPDIITSLNNIVRIESTKVVAG